MKNEITFEDATISHAKEFYGEDWNKSFRGKVAILDGKVVGIGGLRSENKTMILFSDIKDEFRPFKSKIWEAIGILGDMIKDAKYPIVAIASNKEKRSEELLTMLGFIPSGRTDPSGKIFWRFPKWQE